MIDDKGYRYNVGIIICNHLEQVIWAKRRDHYFWQFPQGGINPGESTEQAMYRELFEEIGLRQKDVYILASTNNWLHYKLPKRFVRWRIKPICIGQKQKWFLLKLVKNNEDINIKTSNTPEFDKWRWVNYWYPIRQIVPFKRDIYRKVMNSFSKTVMTVSKYNTKIYC